MDNNSIITFDSAEMGQRIKNVRISKGLTIAEFAEKLSVTEQAVYKWQRGDSVPDIYNLKQISVRFDVTTDYLILGREDDEKSSSLPILWLESLHKQLHFCII